MKPKVVFVPSSGGDSNIGFYRSVGNALLNKSFDVYYVQILPKSNYRVENWFDELEKLCSVIDSNTHLVSHSNGSLAVLQFLSQKELNLKSWHIVGTAFSPESINSKENLLENREQARKFLDYGKVEWDKINFLVENIYLHYSEDDKVVNLGQRELFRSKFPDSVYINYSNKGHFKDTDFPELTEFILNQESNSYTEINGEKLRINLKKTSQLPLKLPIIQDYLPGKDGQSPLENTEWIKIKNSKGEVIGYHESDTMPNWAGSSWYYLRFLDPHNPNEFADRKKLEYWLPVDHYFGGNEHTTLHLLYSRFWHKFLFDQGRVPTSEPYFKRTNGGILLGPDGQKMSKSKGNVVKIKEKLEVYGADAVRMYIAFIGPYEATVIWNDRSLKACRKVVDSIFSLKNKVEKSHPKLTQSDEKVLEDTVKSYQDQGYQIYIDGLVLNHKNQIFSQRRAKNRKFRPGHWDLAGGKLESGESPVNGLKREVFEETGLTPTYIGQIIHTSEFSREKKKAVAISVLVRAEGDFENLKLEKHKIEEFRWFDFRSLEEMKSEIENKQDYVYISIKKGLESLYPPKYLIFDFDGVLGNTWEVHLEAISQKDSIDKEQAKQQMLSIMHNSITEHHKTNPDTTKNIIQLGQIIESMGFSLFQDFISEIEKIPNLKIAVVSSSSREHLLKPALGKTDLNFTHILGQEDHHSKVEKVSRVLKDWQVGPEQVYYFTDTVGDVLELENLLTRDRIIGCCWGWHGRKNLETVLKPENLLFDFADIAGLFDNLKQDSLTEKFYQKLLERAEIEGKDVNVGVIIQNHEGKILAKHRKLGTSVYPDMWEASLFGKLEKNESIFSAVCRELQEETGFELKAVEHYLGCYDWAVNSINYSNPENFNPKQRTFVFLVTVKNPNLKPQIESNKVDQWLWIDHSQLNLFNLNESKGDYWSRVFAKKALDITSPEKKNTLKEFQEIIQNNQIDEVVVCGLLKDEFNRFLLVKRRNEDDDISRRGFWEIPGGTVEKGESFEQALKRKFREETGLEVLEVSNFSDEKIISEVGDKKYLVIAAELKCQGTLALSHEHTSYKFATLSDIQKLKMTSKDKLFLGKLINYFNKNQKTGQLFQTNQINKDLESAFHKFLMGVTKSVSEFKNNVAVAEIMTFVNILKKTPEIPGEIWTGFLRAIAPFTPFIAEELWFEYHGFDSKDFHKSIHLSTWPKFDETKIIQDTVTIAVQINGKLRATLEVSKDLSEKELLTLSKEKVAKWIADKPIKFQKVIPNKLVTFAI